MLSAPAWRVQSVKEAVSLFDEFKKCFAAGDSKLDLASALLGKLKLAMLNFTSLPPATVQKPSEAQLQELLLAREVLEHGALLSVKTMDIPAFERYVAQLKIYYSDCAATLPAHDTWRCFFARDGALS